MSSLEGSPGVAAAEYTQVVVSLDSLGAGTRWLLLAEAALPALATITVCMTLWWLGLSLIRQRAFRRSMAPVLGITAVALIVAGLVGPLLGAIARTRVAEQLGAPDTFWSFLFEADLGPVGWGIALSLIASAFEVGQRLQKDWEGLV